MWLSFNRTYSRHGGVRRVEPSLSRGHELSSKSELTYVRLGRFSSRLDIHLCPKGIGITVAYKGTFYKGLPPTTLPQLLSRETMSVNTFFDSSVLSDGVRFWLAVAL